MKTHPTPFLGLEPEFSNLATASIAVLPFPYEGGVSYGRGAAKAPQAVLDASAFVELYDETLDAEPFRLGIATIPEPRVETNEVAMIEQIRHLAANLIEQDKFVAVIGGDHSISSGFCRALLDRYKTLSVVQIDAHADLRDTYEGSPLSHACAMARMREMTPHTLQLGMRSLSAEEAVRVKREELALWTMGAYRRDRSGWQTALSRLPDPVFLTFDVDALDWSVVSQTGTPEPGGFTWDEIMDVLHDLFRHKRVVGLDLVELSPREGEINSSFAVAKLLYRMIGMKALSTLRQRHLPWPLTATGLSVV